MTDMWEVTGGCRSLNTWLSEYGKQCNDRDPILFRPSMKSHSLEYEDETSCKNDEG